MLYVIYNLEQRGSLLNNLHYVYSELVSDVPFQKSRARLYIICITVGLLECTVCLQLQGAKTYAAFMKLLPFGKKLIQVRWVRARRA